MMSQSYSTGKRTGGTNLQSLISSMEPVLAETTFVFSTLKDKAMQIPSEAIMMFHEDEARTVILPQNQAVAMDLPSTYPCRMITLNVHSSLEAVGFLAAITTRLAAKNISVNPVSAYFHDHLFIPVDKAGDAMAILDAMSNETQ